MQEKHLTITELAEREGVPVTTVYTWNYTGTGPRYMKIGRHVRYKIADVITWENSRYCGLTDVARATKDAGRSIGGGRGAA